MVVQELQRESVATLNTSPVVVVVVHTVGGTTQLASVIRRVQQATEASVVVALALSHLTIGHGLELVMDSQTRVAVAVVQEHMATQTPLAVMVVLAS
jgi:hypothetical protein